jgi:hypothetical protein
MNEDVLKIIDLLIAYNKEMEEFSAKTDEMAKSFASNNDISGTTKGYAFGMLNASSFLAKTFGKYINQIEAIVNERAN